ncbi:MAG: hypothetical protein K6T66_13820 [Peptococcaceae bacterium]|nr:hypothetical protein [Peptococcaceae bacterium]
MSINLLVTEVHEIIKTKGFWDKPRETGTLIALIHSEVSEALEANSCADFCTELADICLRIMDLCGAYNINLEAVLTNIKEDIEADGITIDISSFTKLERSLRQLPPDFNDTKHACEVHKALSAALQADRESEDEDFTTCIGIAFILTLVWASR